MDVRWLQKHRLVYMEFVHFGGAFQMHMHYDTNNWLPTCLTNFIS